MLQLKNITKVFLPGTQDENVLFNNLNLTINDKEFVSIVGSNGSGKTTLLNLICSSLTPDGGSIVFDNNDITKLKQHKRARFIGRVMQDPKSGTCPSLTILENMALADNKNRHYGLTRAINKKRIDYYKSLLEKCGIGLENRLSAVVGTLSGGQRQALALVIANMNDIKLLILDEHTAALDPKSSETVMRITDEFVKEKNVTAIMVTHNLRFAVQYGTRLIMMHAGQFVMDIKGEQKQNATVDTLLDKFNSISIESGN